MTFIHANRLPASTRGHNILANSEPETMTLQGFSIKSKEWAPERRFAGRGLFHKLVVAASAILHRGRRAESPPLWMLPEWALRDIGYEGGEAEVSRLTDAGSTPLRHFGFAPIIFQNRGQPPYRGTDWSIRSGR